MNNLGNAFESSDYLVSWAQKEAGNFRALGKAFLNKEDTCTHVTEFDTNSQRYFVKMRFNLDLPDEARGIASNVIKNFRDALDQATFAASFLVRRKASKRTHFPFGESPTDLERSLSLREAPQCKGIPEELFPALRACEPYPTGDEYAGGDNYLRALARVSGPHKHAVTLGVKIGAPAIGIGGKIEVGPGGAIFSPGFYNLDAGENEVALWSYPIGGYVNADVRVPLYIGFGPGPIEGMIVDTFFDELSVRVAVAVKGLKEATAQIIGNR